MFYVIEQGIDKRSQWMNQLPLLLQGQATVHCGHLPIQRETEGSGGWRGQFSRTGGGWEGWELECRVRRRGWGQRGEFKNRRRWEGRWGGIWRRSWDKTLVAPVPRPQRLLLLTARGWRILFTGSTVQPLKLSWNKTGQIISAFPNKSYQSMPGLLSKHFSGNPFRNIVLFPL